MPKPPHKFNLLLDENMESRKLFTRINNFHNVKHLTEDLKKSGITDNEVFLIAKHNRRILLTYNFQDFKNFKLTDQVGIVGISRNLKLIDVDKKVMSFLRNKVESELYGYKHYVSGESTRSTKR